MTTTTSTTSTTTTTTTSTTTTTTTSTLTTSTSLSREGTSTAAGRTRPQGGQSRRRGRPSNLEWVSRDFILEGRLYSDTCITAESRPITCRLRCLHRLQVPLKRVHTPVNVHCKKVLAQDECTLKVKRGHVPPAHYRQPATRQVRPAYNPSSQFRCPGQNQDHVTPRNGACNGGIPELNNYWPQPVKQMPLESHKDNSYNNNNNYNGNCKRNENSKNSRPVPKVPLLGLPQVPIWSDYEPSPSRLRDEERKRQDKVLFFLCQVLNSSCHNDYCRHEVFVHAVNRNTWRDSKRSDWRT